MLNLIQLTSGWLQSLGLVTVFVILLVESLGIPAPSEIVLLLAGLLVAEGHFAFWAVVLTGAMGSVTGASLSYWLARIGGREFVLRHLSFIFRSESRLNAWSLYFQRHGDRIILVGRLISGVRMLISYPAGIFHMPWWRFLIFTALGALMWPALAAGLGWYLGPKLTAALATLHAVQEWGLLALTALIVGFWLYRRWKPRTRSTPEP